MVQKDNLIAIEYLQSEYNDLKAESIHIDFSRGRPSPEQLDLSSPLLDQVSSKSSFLSDDNIDVRNYGCVDGIIECKKMMSILLGVDFNNILLFGNSSLKMMYDQICRSYTHGVCGSTPWCKLPKVKWLCPVPGYDRHFAITEHFGIEMINIPMNDDGPNMDLIEEYVKDESVKGIWCTPIYSNPSGITYSNKTVERFAKLKPAAKDFRIYWDKAYAIHGFEKNEKLLNLFDEAKKYFNEDIVYIFSSTSKITFPSGGIAAMGCSEKNLLDIKNNAKYEIVSYDKINQLRHGQFFNNEQQLINHTSKSMHIVFDKIHLCLEYFETHLFGYATWTKPTGGYFILIQVKNVAKEVIKGCLECGLVLTDFGSCHPYHLDNTNSYIRIAPSGLEKAELIKALRLLCISIKLETLKKQYTDDVPLLISNKKVSVVVPVYNVEKYLEKCLNSVLGQTHSNLEIIVVNDGSTDSSRKICEKFVSRDSRIKLINKDNGGLGSSRNRGLDECTGDYVYFIDSDDWIELETIENMLYLSVLTNSDIVCSDGVITDGSHEYDRCFQSKETATIKSSSEIVKEILKNTIMSQVVKGLYSRKCWNDVRFPENRLYEDIPTTYKAFLHANQVAYLDRPFYKYRHNNTSISYTPNPVKSYHIFLGFKDHFDYAKLNFPSIANDCLPNCIIYALSTYFHYCSDAKTELSFCKNEVINFLTQNKKKFSYKQIIKSRRFMLRLFYFSKTMFWLFCKILKITRLQRLLKLEVK